ncbi:hypothetical protein [Porphyromonas gingivalis]|nr:hypothetical protein [Porphyromonas gingivalis]
MKTIEERLPPKRPAEKTERARLNTSQANELQKQAESIKQRK